MRINFNGFEGDRYTSSDVHNIRENDLTILVKAGEKKELDLGLRIPDEDYD